MKPGQPTTHTYDYKHYGTTTLFADLNVLEGKVISRRMQRRRNQKLIRFLNTVQAAVPAGKIVHAIMTTTPFTNTRRSVPGSSATRGFTFHFSRLQPRGSTP